MIDILAPSSARSFRHWLIHLGGVGFIPLGILDSSILPLPGSMDLLTVVLAARDVHMWLYYALMATLGSTVGAYITYRLARKGGEEALNKTLRSSWLRRFNRINKVFHRTGFLAIFIPAILPPPVPMVPFVIAAGAMQYSTARFLTAFGLGRAIRYTALAYLATIYGRQIRKLLNFNVNPAIVIAVMILMTAGAAYGLYRASKK